MTTAREIMTPTVLVARREEPVSVAAQRMRDEDVGWLPVRNRESRIDGVITDRDIVVRVVASALDPDSTSIGDIVDEREVVTVGADDSADEAARLMREHAIRRLPVIDGHDVVGIISQGDFATAMPQEATGRVVEAISEAP